MIKTILSVLFICTFLASSAQQADTLKSDISGFIYDKDYLSKEFHASRRAALRAAMPDSSVAVFFANPVRNRSNDVDYEYHQDPDFYYLTGLREPNSVLIIYKETWKWDSISDNEVIFVQPRNPKYELWNGRRYGVNGVKNLLGFTTAVENTGFPDFKWNFPGIRRVFYNLPEKAVHDNPHDRGDLASMTKHFRSRLDSTHDVSGSFELKEIMKSLREIKLTEELALMRKAIDFTCEAQQELMKALEPGMTEYQAEAIVEYVFKKNGAEFPGFPSIVGGGENSCILHYTSNRKSLSENDMLVVDIGAEYHGYSADVTRTLPVDGHFSNEQKTIYNIVLEAQEAGIKACKKGNKFWEPGDAAKRVIQQRLIEIGLIEYPADYSIYFPHGTSHYLGLDVHDAGLYGNLKPGQVITVEPGIYIPDGSDCDPKWWNIGVRIEDDVLITDWHPEVLSDCVPKSIDEIEKLMQESGIFRPPGKQ